VCSIGRKKSEKVGKSESAGRYTVRDRGPREFADEWNELDDRINYRATRHGE